MSTIPGSKEERISDSLLTLRAAQLLSQSIQRSSSQDERQHPCTSSCSTSSSHKRLSDVVGDFGSALFNPLDEDLLRTSCSMLNHNNNNNCLRLDGNAHASDDSAEIPSSRRCSPLKHQQLHPPSSSQREISPLKSGIFLSTSTAATSAMLSYDDYEGDHEDKASLEESSTSEDDETLQTQEDTLTTMLLGCSPPRVDLRDDDNSDNIQSQNYMFDYDAFPVQVELPDDPSEYIEAPPILDASALQEFADRALPRNLRIYKWKRIFSIAKDGDLMFTMLEKCATFKHTLMACRTTHGHILGGFASEKWEDQDGYDKRHSYFGTGTCFLFSNHPKIDPMDTKTQFNFYKWSGVNDYCQICDTSTSRIAMGGGHGDFGLVIEDGFFRGTSGHCATFDNPPLIPGIDGSFEIVDFEVYGLLPLLSSSSLSTDQNQSRSAKFKCRRSMLGAF